jgi:hypothetical protein
MKESRWSIAMNEINEADRNALTRAFETARRDPAERRRVDGWLAAGRSWEDVAGSAACHCQHTALGLKPWQLPPVSPTIANHLDNALLVRYGDPSGAREAAEIIKKLLALGLSKFEPDPLAAISEAEAKRQQPAK